MIIRRTRPLIVWGALLGILSFSVMLVDYYSVHHFYLPWRPLEEKVLAGSLGLSIYLALQSYRKSSAIPLHIPEGMRIGLILSFCTGLFWAVLSTAYVSTFPSYVSQMLAESSKRLSSATASESVGVRFGAELLYSPWGQFLSKLIVSIFFGAFFSLVITILFRWKDRTSAKTYVTK